MRGYPAPVALIVSLWKAGLNTHQIVEAIGLWEGQRLNPQSVQHVVSVARRTDPTIPRRTPGYRGVPPRLIATGVKS